MLQNILKFLVTLNSLLEKGKKERKKKECTMKNGRETRERAIQIIIGIITIIFDNSRYHKRGLELKHDSCIYINELFLLLLLFPRGGNDSSF